MNVKLISVTPKAEEIMAYCARVSSPNQDNPKYEKLFEYCVKEGHWSVFEMADMTLEIETSRGIAPQLLRHKSFSFQEFSQRYAKVDGGFELYEARRQDLKNRQNSIDDMSDKDKLWFKDAQTIIHKKAVQLYQVALDKGIAKEQARFLLPLNTTTKLYMKGSVRSWIHYINLRSGNGTQKEHRDIALAAKEIFKVQFPTLAKSLDW